MGGDAPSQAAIWEEGSSLPPLTQSCPPLTQGTRWWLVPSPSHSVIQEICAKAAHSSSSPTALCELWIPILQ